jgi:hypothetical protein
MTKRTDRPVDPGLWTQGDIEAQVNENVALRKRNYELEQWCIRAQDALRRPALDARPAPGAGGLPRPPVGSQAQQGRRDTAVVYALARAMAAHTGGWAERCGLCAS